MSYSRLLIKVCSEKAHLWNICIILPNAHSVTSNIPVTCLAQSLLPQPCPLQYVHIVQSLWLISISYHHNFSAQTLSHPAIIQPIQAEALVLTAEKRLGIRSQHFTSLIRCWNVCISVHVCVCIRVCTLGALNPYMASIVMESLGKAYISYSEHIECFWPQRLEWWWWGEGRGGASQV